jgi:hypothetical protein
VLDHAKGKYVTWGSSALWLIPAGGEAVRLAKPEVDGQAPQVVWGRLSPDGNYAICTTGSAVGEPHIAWAGDSYHFDLGPKKPVLIRKDASDLYVGWGGFVGWVKSSRAFLHVSVREILSTSLPDLKIRTVFTLPEGLELLDYVAKG